MTKEALSFPIHSQKLKTAEEVESAVNAIATKIARRISRDNPVVICIMNGGLMFCSELIKQFNFAMQLDYMHVSRYQGEMHGGQLDWIKEPSVDLAGRTVLLVDDIFDEGITLEQVYRYCLTKNAKQVYSAVLVKKSKSREIDYVPDFFALTLADDYLFGMGMDYKTYWRNSRAIYALIPGE